MNEEVVYFFPENRQLALLIRTVNPSKSGTTSSNRFMGSTLNRPLLVNRPSFVPPFPL